MIGRKGRQECLPPSQECLRSYICKPANYQPPAMIELVFDRFSPAPNLGQQGISAFLFKKRVKGIDPCVRFNAGSGVGAFKAVKGEE